MRQGSTHGTTRRAPAALVGLSSPKGVALGPLRPLRGIVPKVGEDLSAARLLLRGPGRARPAAGETVSELAGVGVAHHERAAMPAGVALGELGDDVGPDPSSSHRETSAELLSCRELPSRLPRWAGRGWPEAGCRAGGAKMFLRCRGLVLAATLAGVGRVNTGLRRRSLQTNPGVSALFLGCGHSSTASCGPPSRKPQHIATIVDVGGRGGGVTFARPDLGRALNVPARATREGRIQIRELAGSSANVILRSRHPGPRQKETAGRVDTLGRRSIYPSPRHLRRLGA